MASEGTIDLVGRTLGPYEVRSKLGQGGMGAVYLAFDKTLDREVALKVLPPEYSRDASYIQRFEREAKSLARLRHPNLIHIYSVGDEDAVHYFAMELIQGETLADYMRKRGPLPEDEVLNLGSQILCALQAIHRIGITHRDIKSSNIMIDGPGHAVLMDFGLAKDRRESGLTTAGSVLGTPEYMAPEQIQGEEVSPASDIYSFGVLLFEMISGRLPFIGNTMIAILRAHCDQPPPPLSGFRPDISKDLIRIVEKALAKTIGNRYSSAAEMARDLFELHPVPELKEIAGEARNAKTLRLKPAAPKQSLQTATVVAGIVILLLALLTVGGALRKARNKPVQPPVAAAPLVTAPPAVPNVVSAKIRLKSGSVVEGKLIGTRRSPPDKIFFVVITPAGDERALPAGEIDVIEYGQ